MKKENILNSDFFNRDTLTVAKELPGKNIIRNYSGIFLRAKIVEVEAYLGINDKASHSYNSRRTKRNEVMYGKAGGIYVYLIYGMYYLLNFVTKDINEPEAVLIRAVEPLDGINFMAQNRFGDNYRDLTNKRKINLTNGPGKLTKALAIDKTLNGKDLFTDELFVEDTDNKEKIFIDKRIGIDYAEEAKDYPYRFYIDNPYISKKL